MGIETFPVVEKHGTYDFFVVAEWKWLTKYLGEIDTFAKAMGLTPLRDFVNYSRNDAIADSSEKDVQETEGKAELRNGVYYIHSQVLWSSEDRWFEPEKALETVRGVLEYLNSQGDNTMKFEYEEDGVTCFFEDDDEKTYSLKALERVLSLINEEGKRFYLKVSV
jgi:hypothetical protein